MFKEKINFRISGKLILGYFILFIGLYLFAPYIYKDCESTYQDKIYLFLYDEKVLLGLFFVGILLIIGIWIQRALFNRAVSLLRKILSFLVLLIPISLVSFIYFSLVTNPYGGIGGGTAHIASGYDGRKYDTLKFLRADLEVYFAKHHYYPESLSELISSDTYNIIKEIPIDPDTDKPYEYAVFPDKKNYVLRTIFGVNHHNQTCDYEHFISKHNVFLNTFLNDWDDLDGNIMGFDCNDPAYCLQSIDAYPPFKENP